MTTVLYRPAGTKIVKKSGIVVIHVQEESLSYRYSFKYAKHFTKIRCKAEDVRGYIEKYRGAAYDTVYVLGDGYPTL